MHQAVLLIGGNLGDRRQLIQQTHGMLSGLGAIKASSGIYETQAWGKVSEGKYLNQALLLETLHSPAALLQLTQDIENTLGRTRDRRWGDRTMDIDIIYFDDLIYQDERLILPHPLMSERNFVLVPLVEIMADFIHPEFKVSNKELLRRCQDAGQVEKYHKV